MIFNSLWPMAFLIAIPVIIILYLLKPKGKDEKISSNILWMRLFKNTQSKTFFEKFVHSILMYLQILISILLICALMSPYINVKGVSDGNVIIIIDTSASMQHMTSSGDTRMDEAISAACDYVEGSRNTKFTIITCDKSANLLITNSEDTKRVKDVLKEIKATDMSGDISKASGFIETMYTNNKSGEKAKVVIFTDGNGADTAKLFSDKYDAEISVLGNSVSNACIDYVVTTKKETGYDVAVKITNYSENEASMEISLYDGDADIIDVRQLTINPGESTVSIFKDIEWKSEYLKATLTGISFSSDEKDSLLADNTSYAVKDNKSFQAAVLIGSGNTYIEKAYAAITGNTIVKAENDYMLSDGEYKVAIYDSGAKISDTTNKEGLANRIVLNGNDNKSETLKNVMIKVPEGELTTGLSDFQIGVNEVTCYSVPEWAKSFMECNGKSVGYYGEHDGIKEVVIGFNIRESDFPLCAEFPVFMANVLGYLSDTSILTTNVYNPGDKVSFNPSADYDIRDIKADIDKAGIYSVTVGDKTEYYIVKFATENESDGRDISDGVHKSEEYKELRVKKGLRNILLAISLILLIIEWIIYVRQMRYKGKFYLIIRIAGSILVILAMLGLSVSARSRSITTVFVVDMSESNRNNVDEMTSYLKDTLSSMPKKNKYGIVTFGKDSEIEQFVTDENAFTGLMTSPDTNATNIEAAIENALSMMSGDEAGRIIVLTDGRETAGNVFDMALALTSCDIELDSITFSNEYDNDAYVSDVTMPGTIHPGDEYSIKVEVESNYDTAATINLTSGSNKIMSDEVHLNKGKNQFIFRQTASLNEIESYKVTVLADGDSCAENDSYNVYSKVVASPKILVVSGLDENSENFKSLLTAAGANFNIVSAINAPETLNDMLQYKSIILENVFIDDLPEGFINNLDSYVKDYGCGFICCGGEDSFALGGYRDSVIEDVLPVNMELMGVNETPKMAMVMVIDHSGSMLDSVSGTDGVTNLDIAIKAATGAVTNLRDTDYVGVLTFDDTYAWQVKITEVKDKEAINASIESINYGGGTTIKPALNEAYKEISKIDAKIKHIILLTDGMGETNNFKDVCDKINESGITLSTVAVGQSSDSRLLKNLAENCGGRYYYSDISTDIPKIFAQEVFLSGDTYIQNGEFSLKVVGSNQLVNGLFTDGWPTIYGYISATPKTASNVIISSVEKNSPILTTWQYGLGKTVAWNTDVKNEWTGAYAGNSDYVELWKRIIDYTSGNSNLGEDSVDVKKEAGSNVITYATDDYSDSTDITGVYTAPDGNAGEVEFVCVEPGKYEAKLNDSQVGLYNINVRRSDDGEITNVVTTAAIVQYSDEYKFDIGSGNYEAFIEKYGRNLTKTDNIWRKIKTNNQKKFELTEIFIILAIILFVYDIAVRRFCYEPKKINISLKRKKVAGSDNNVNYIVSEEVDDISSSKETSKEKIMVQEENSNIKADKKEKAKKEKAKNISSSTMLDTSQLLKKKEDRNI